MVDKRVRTGSAEWHLNRTLAGQSRAGAHSRRLLLLEQRNWLRTRLKAIVVVVLTGLGLVGLGPIFLPDGMVPYWQGAIIVSIPWVIYTAMLETGGMIPKMAGIEAEERTAEEIRGLRSDGWRLVNHVLLDHADVDHVALGPGGFLAIETKYRADWNYSRSQVNEFTRQVNLRTRRLEVRIGPKARAQPVVVLWGRAAEEIVPGPTEWDDAIVCPGEQLAFYMSSLPPKYNEAEIAIAFESLRNYVRLRDVGEASDWTDLPRRSDMILLDGIAVVVTIYAGILVPAILAEQLRPASLWSAGGAGLLAAIAALVRRRWPGRRRLRLAAKALLLPAILWLVIIGGVTAYGLIN